MDKQSLKTICQYVELKRKESDAKSAASLLKQRFFAACEKIAPLGNGIEIDGVVIYSRECKKYHYSRAILAAEKRLAALKSAFEKKNAPADVVKTWAVKL